MYLKKVIINNFRGIKKLDVEFNPGINVIIGGNNVGKTAIIDALRIAFSFGKNKKDIFVSTDDFHIDSNGKKADEIGLDLFFGGLTEEEEAVFHEMLILEPKIEAQIHIRFRIETKKGIEHIRAKFWGGEKEGQTVGEALDLMYHVFLGALRDAERDLRPGRNSLVGQLMRKITPEGDQKKLEEEIYRAVENISDLKKEIEKADKIINENLSNITIGDITQQKVSLNLIKEEYGAIVDTIKALLPIRDKKDIQLELHQNGMGYNNLIYIGTVLGDLKKRKEAEPYTFNSLLIEEPEAHLHPQLQKRLFSFLKNIALSKEIDNTSIQVFITSHSPTLASRAELDSIIVLYQNNEGVIQATSLKNCELDEDHKNDLMRYLDVTKSQLFFAKGVLIVEGISEALLLPVLANKCLNKSLENHAIEIVNVSGTAFEPFALLFNSNNENKRINIPTVIITDDDRGKFEKDENEMQILKKIREGSLSERAEKAKRLENGMLKVEMAYKTFEFELAKNPKNIPVIIACFKEIHPIAAEKLEERIKILEKPEEKAVSIWKSLRNYKAEFAQRLAAVLDKSDKEFEMPEYIENAVEYVVEKIQVENGNKS